MIPFLPRGRQFVTLKDAAKYIQKLPKAEKDLDEWQAAVEALLLVAELDGPTMMARIGMLRALNRNVERVFNPSRKDTQWGKRKLKRDQMSRHEKPGKKAGLIANIFQEPRMGSGNHPWRLSNL